jgi:spermidine synthase
MKPTTTLAECRTPRGDRLTLIQHDRDYFLMLGSEQLMSTNACASEQRMAELGCVDLPPQARVLIGGLGLGFTLRRVLELVPPGALVEVAELLPEILEWNRKFLLPVNGGLLDDERVKVELRDVFDYLVPAVAGQYHVILLDVDNSPDPLVQQDNERLYSAAGLQRIHGALCAGGRVVFWSGCRDDGFARALRRVFREVECVRAKSYPRAKNFTHTLFVARK